MRLPKILAVVVGLVVIAALAAWRLYPVEILVFADRLRHPVAATRPVHWAPGPATPPAGDRPPNIVLIVADDLGINDITLEGAGRGIAGGLVPTPNIDAIARQGAQFTQGYAANATCSPSRAALMTGQDSLPGSALNSRPFPANWQNSFRATPCRGGHTRRFIMPSARARRRRPMRWACPPTR